MKRRLIKQVAGGVCKLPLDWMVREQKGEEDRGDSEIDLAVLGVVVQMVR